MSKGDDNNQGRFQAACVQFDVERGLVEKNLRSAQAGVTAAAAAGARLIVLPELWTTSFVEEITDTLVAKAEDAEEKMLRISGDLECVIVGSSLEKEGDRCFNRAVVMDHGRQLGSYRKIHLFSPNAENKYFAPGSEPSIAETSVGTIGILICYDIRFPELVRYYFHKGVQLLVVPAQWPEARSLHWRTMLQARAIENELFVVGCNRTGLQPSLKTGEPLHFPGDSRIIDPMGEILAAGSGEDGPVLAEIELRKVRTMRRILPVCKDQRPMVYKQLWDRAWEEQIGEEDKAGLDKRV